MKPYTYLIRHRPTGQVYYGVRTANTAPAEEDLWNHYFTSSNAVKQLIKETGADSFDFEVRQEFDTVEQAIARETGVLRRMRVLEKDQWINANIAGYIVLDETSRQKISEYHKGKSKSPEHRAKISKALKGKPKYYCRTEEYRSKMSLAKSSEKNAMYGRKHSPETLAKISAALRGHTHAWNKGIPQSEERKKHQSRVMTGRKQDPEVVARRSETMRAMKMKRERKVCEHCNKDVAVNIYARYHGEKCKLNKKSLDK